MIHVPASVRADVVRLSRNQVVLADVQHTLCLDHDLFADTSQGHTQHRISLNFRAQVTKSILVDLVMPKTHMSQHIDALVQ